MSIPSQRTTTYAAKQEPSSSAERYLLRADFDARHWTAALRVLLAREIQHDSSSDRDVCAAFAVDAGAYFHAHHALAPETGALLGHRILNILEQARTDNILCRRFPGYLPLLRFVCYAQLEAAEPGSALEALLCELEAFALTGIPCRDPALSTVRAEVEAAILAPSAAACADIGRRILAALAPELARLCRAADADALTRIAAQLVDYAFSETDRAELFGDGCDSRLRLHSEAQDAAHSGPSADGEDADLDKGDSAAGGSGDNSERHGDMSGSLASQEVKPSGSAGTNGREDRGRSSSVGRSGNHGQSGATATTSDTVSAAQRRLPAAESLREVLGTGWGAHRGAALSAAEMDAMLATAEEALARERTLEQQLHVATPRAVRLDAGERQGLADRYAGLTFTETYITPGSGRLPPAFAERAKALHHRLDKLLRQQRERSASQRTGALSQRELWKIPLDAKDVFRRKAPPSKRETAFYLLIDRSGSMGAGIGDGNSKLFTALATAAVLEEALKGIAYTKIVAFDGGTNAVEHCVIKDFDQKEIGCRCIDAMTQIAAGNGNKDGYSIRAAALDLAKRTERRRILMVLSDGLPSGYFSESEAIDDVRTAVQAARRRGLLVIPIIYTARTDENVDAYRRMYEKSMIFADSVGMLGEFERLLMKLVC
ncbi:MAG: cobaltochelatase CobT-related protein [Oscillospiraceae bacterium]